MRARDSRAGAVVRPPEPTAVASASIHQPIARIAGAAGICVYRMKSVPAATAHANRPTRSTAAPPPASAPISKRTPTTAARAATCVRVVCAEAAFASRLQSTPVRIPSTADRRDERPFPRKHTEQGTGLRTGAAPGGQVGEFRILWWRQRPEVPLVGAAGGGCAIAARREGRAEVGRSECVRDGPRRCVCLSEKRWIHAQSRTVVDARDTVRRGWHSRGCRFDPARLHFAIRSV